TIRSRSAGRTTSAGDARRPPGSQRATPTRTSPTSMPRRTPRRIRLTPVRHLGADGELDLAQGLGHLGRVGAATLRDVVLPATAAPEHAGRDLDELTGRQPPGATHVVDRDDDGRATVRHTDDRHDRGP